MDNRTSNFKPSISESSLRRRIIPKPTPPPSPPKAPSPPGYPPPPGSSAPGSPGSSLSPPKAPSPPGSPPPPGSSAPGSPPPPGSSAPGSSGSSGSRSPGSSAPGSPPPLDLLHLDLLHGSPAPGSGSPLSLPGSHLFPPGYFNYGSPPPLDLLHLDLLHGSLAPGSGSPLSLPGSHLFPPGYFNSGSGSESSGSESIGDPGSPLIPPGFFDSGSSGSESIGDSGSGSPGSPLSPPGSPLGHGTPHVPPHVNASEAGNESVKQPMNEKKTEWVMLITSVLLEAMSGVFDQVRYAFMGMVIAFLALFLSGLYLIWKARKESVRRSQPSGALLDYYGLAAAVWQCFYSTMEYLYTRKNRQNPIKICLLPFMFALLVLLFSLFKCRT